MISGGFTVTDWQRISLYKLDKRTKKPILNGDGTKKGEKKMNDKRFDLAEFDGRDGFKYSAGYYKRAEVWNVHQIARKIIVSCMASGVIEAKDSE